MAQKTTGLYSLTQISGFYETFQRLLGATRGRQRLVDDHIRPAPGARVLDLGCGPAAILPMLGDVQYIGIDANTAHIDAARAEHGDKGQFIADDFACLKQTQGQSFDLVLCLGLLHHLDDHRVAELAHLARSYLAPGGRFIALDPVFEDGQHAIARWLAAGDSGQNVRGEQGYADLVRPAFADTRTVVRHDLLRIPYSHCITIARAP